MIPVEVYLRTAYEPDAEFVDGEVEVRAAGEYDHSTWQYALQQWFDQHAREWDLRVRVELRVQVKASRFRVPDVVVLDRKEPIEQIVTRPPVAVFEVLSPEDSMTRVMGSWRIMPRGGFPTSLSLIRGQRFFNGIWPAAWRSASWPWSRWKPRRRCWTSLP